MQKIQFTLFFIFYFFSVSIYASEQCRVTEKIVSPAIYKGKCVNGTANGYGVASHKILAITYKGQFKNGRFNGSGTLTIEQKDETKKIWEGKWRNGELNGYGKFTSSTLLIKGQWVNGKQTGQGESKNLLNGTTSKGQFKDYALIKGRLTFSDGSYVQGQWVDGKLSGYVIETMKNGSIYKGQYKNNTKHGKGIFIFSDGSTTSGVWNNGKAVSGNVMKFLNKPNHRNKKTNYQASPVTQCFKKAFENLGLHRGGAIELCKGTNNAIEVTRCYEKAWGNQANGGLGLHRGGAIDLCKGTSNANKVIQCFVEAWNSSANGGLGLTRGGAIGLCSKSIHK